MATRLTDSQRGRIRELLGQGLNRDEIAAMTGATPGQVSAIAAHVKMGTYGTTLSDTEPAEASGEIAASTVAAIVERQKAEPSPAAIEVLIGNDLDTGETRYWVPTPETGTPNPHLLIIGESGSGKTYATQCICAELAQQALPTIVFDFGQGFGLSATPHAFIEYAKPIEINAGRDGININPLQIFPSDIHGPVNVAQRVADTFARIYPAIGVQQHAVLREAILQAFRHAGIDPQSKRTWQLRPPRFSELKLTLEEIAQDKSEPMRRFAAAVASHISTVFVFNTFRATGLDLDWASMIATGGRAYIVQLKGLEDLLERVVTELLLWNLIGYIESLGPGQLRCLVLLDEAHRLSFASNSPVEKLLREGRKFGLGVVLASQQPEDFSSVAFTNTATKLVFNVTDERGAVARQIARKASGNSSLMALLRRVGTLRRGEACLLNHEHAVIVGVADFPSREARWKAQHP